MNIKRDNGAAPTLYDIGYSLSKTPRFGGHTCKVWTVLHHLYACARYAELKGHPAKVQRYALLHDGHEAVTSDIPQPWKTDEMRELQRQLDVRLYSSLGISQPSLATERLIHHIDSQMLYAEAKYAAPQVAEALRIPGDNFREGIDPLDEKADLAVFQTAQYLNGDIGNPTACGINFANKYHAYTELIADD